MHFPSTCITKKKLPRVDFLRTPYQWQISPKNFLDYNVFFLGIRIVENKAQIACMMREHQKPRELPGPLSGPLTPTLRDFGLRDRDVRVRTHTSNLLCTPPPPHENPGSAHAYCSILPIALSYLDNEKEKQTTQNIMYTVYQIHYSIKLFKYSKT